MGKTTLADVLVSGPTRKVEVVGVFTGSQRLAFLARELGGHAGFVALDQYSARLTQRPFGATYSNVVNAAVVERLRECFPS